MLRRRITALGLSALGITAVIAAIALAPAGCSHAESDPWATAASGKPKVLVSFAPIYSFAKSVAGEDAEVRCLLTTTGPHYHGDATPPQLALAKGCDVFIINGLGLDDELPKGLGRGAGKELAVLDLGSKINKDWLLEGECKHDHHHAGEHVHPTDPHVWLGIKHAKVMVQAIRDELKRIDPSHAGGYDDRATKYLGKLDELEAEGKKMIAAKQEKSIVSFHEALQYFGECYGINIAAVIELQPGKEPTTDNLKEIVKKCQRQNVRVIAVEPQFPRNTAARVIRDELRQAQPPIEAEFAEVDPLETCNPDELSADLYERKMRENLANLTKVIR
jgi:zinc transport system substrate-binding protein